MIFKINKIETNQLFGRGHFAIAVHSRDRVDAVVLHVERKKVVRLNVAAVDDLIPRRSVSDVKQASVKLSRPEERNSIEPHVASHHIACRRPSLLLCCPPVLDSHALPRARIGIAGYVTSSVKSVGGTQPRINDNGACMVQLDTIHELRNWSHSDSDDDHVRLNALAVVERDRFNVVTALEPV